MNFRNLKTGTILDFTHFKIELLHGANIEIAINPINFELLVKCNTLKNKIIKTDVLSNGKKRIQVNKFVRTFEYKLNDLNTDYFNYICKLDLFNEDQYFEYKKIIKLFVKKIYCNICESFISPIDTIQKEISKLLLEFSTTFISDITKIVKYSINLFKIQRNYNTMFNYLRRMNLEEDVKNIESFYEFRVMSIDGNIANNDIANLALIRSSEQDLEKLQSEFLVKYNEDDEIKNMISLQHRMEITIDNIPLI